MRLTRALAGAAAAILAAACAFAAGAPASSAPSAGCPPVPDASAARIAAAPPVDRGLLWKISRDGHASYLYGTLHIGRPEWTTLGPRVGEALASADVVGLELDVTDPGILARLAGALMSDRHTPALPPALAARLEAQARAACVDPAAFAKLRPEMRAVTVALAGGRRFGLDPAYAIDGALAALGHRQDKSVRSIETPELQAALLVSDDPAEVARSVAEVLAEMERSDYAEQLRRLADDWRRGDLDDLSRYARWCGCMDTPAQRADFARMVDDRNAAMAARIAQWHDEGRSVFAAVGSLHMIGPVGLPVLLRARGFEVERVEFGGRR
jgi:uncharacterized protein YbaP (TraB family)